MKKLLMLFCGIVFVLAGCGGTNTSESDVYGDFVLIDSVVAKIHEDMPKFTFLRFAGGCIEDESFYCFPLPRQVKIIIEDERGNVIQTISGLAQSIDFIKHGISFADFNFDGFLDISLLRWQDGAGALFANQYFWLWDSAVSQFVRNEQLMNLGHAGIYANQETRRLQTWLRTPGGGLFSFYEYQGGVFELAFVHEEGFADAWQEAYASLLRLYYFEQGENLRFAIHDINLSGMPQLFIVGEDVDVVYTFTDGRAMRLGYGEGLKGITFLVAARAGIMSMPNSTSGVIAYIMGPGSQFGASTFYWHLKIDGDSLVVHAFGENLIDPQTGEERFLLNGNTISEEEFWQKFTTGERLSTFEVNEANIREVFGIYS